MEYKWLELFFCLSSRACKYIIFIVCFRLNIFFFALMKSRVAGGCNSRNRSERQGLHILSRTRLLILICILFALLNSFVRKFLQVESQRYQDISRDRHDDSNERPRRHLG